MIIVENRPGCQNALDGVPSRMTGRQALVKATFRTSPSSFIAKTSLWTTCGQSRIRCFPKTTISTRATAEMSEGQTNSLAATTALGAGDSLWQACMDQLVQEMPKQQFNTWIKPLAAQVSDDF